MRNIVSPHKYHRSMTILGVYISLTDEWSVAILTGFQTLQIRLQGVHQFQPRQPLLQEVPV